MQDLLETKEEYGFDLKDSIYVLGTLFEAGSETTTNTLLAFFMAMAL